jgi:hypothetical protein
MYIFFTCILPYTSSPNVLWNATPCILDIDAHRTSALYCTSYMYSAVCKVRAGDNEVTGIPAL